MSDNYVPPNPVGNSQGDGEESVEEKYAQLRDLISERKKDIPWWLIVSFFLQFACFLWGVILSSTTSGTCDKPVRGIILGMGIVLGVSAVMTICTFWNIQVTYRRFISPTHDVLAEEDPEAIEKERLTPSEAEKKIATSITDRMVLTCCTCGTQICAYLSLIGLLIAGMVYVWRADCVSTAWGLVSQGRAFSLVSLFVLLLHIPVYIRWYSDCFYLWEVHFMEQTLIKTEGKNVRDEVIRSSGNGYGEKSQ